MNKIINYIQSNLSEYRFNHTIGVAQTAKELAVKYGENPDKAYMAGLLHDCAKELSYNEMINIIKKYQHKTDDITEKSTALLHSIAGAYISKELFDIDDDVFDAIAYHTTGKPNMGLLTKIIYIADFIEPNRSFDGVEMVRKEAYINLDSAIIKACDTVIVHTVNKGGLLHPNTISARNYLLLYNRSVADNEKIQG